MSTFPSNKPKKKIRKTEREKYWDLNEVFNFIGEKLKGESWHQISDSGTVLGVYENLCSMIRNEFFDLHDADNSGDELGEIEKESMLTKKSAEIIFNQENVINYSFPKNFLVPKEQFEYVLQTGKRWTDKNPDPQNNGLIISKQQTNFTDITYNWMVKVGDKKNLFSYTEITLPTSEASLTKRLFVEKWEIDFWLDFVQTKDLARLKSKDVDDDGYVYVDERPSSDRNYVTTFYYKEQLDKFYPKEKFTDYETLTKAWKKDFWISEDEATKILSQHILVPEVQRLASNEDFRKNPSCINDIELPLHKNKRTQFQNRLVFESDSKTIRNGFSNSADIYEERARFVREAVFERSYLEAIEKHYFSNLQRNSKDSAKKKAGRKTTFDEVGVWKIFIESLEGVLNDANNDYAKQAWEAYCKLDAKVQATLAFVQNNSITKQNIIAHLLEKTERKMGGKTNLDDKIATPFAKQFPEIPSL